jgi:hypothetical protein
MQLSVFSRCRLLSVVITLASRSLWLASHHCRPLWSRHGRGRSLPFIVDGGGPLWMFVGARHWLLLLVVGARHHWLMVGRPVGGGWPTSSFVDGGGRSSSLFVDGGDGRWQMVMGAGGCSWAFMSRRCHSL